MIELKSFIRTDQFNFIKRQVQNLVNGHATAIDNGVMSALKSMTLERVLVLFPIIEEEQVQLLQPISLIDNKEEAEAFLSQLKPYVMPFKVSEQGIKKLFPKAKKLKVPSLAEIDLREIAYLSWTDTTSNKRYIVINRDSKLIGIEGSFTPSNQKGVCSICNSHKEVGMFLAKVKGKEQGTFKTRGNYICHDSQSCNKNLTSLDKLNNFVDLLK
ncbi:FusB/FusC family EF-G-binding protein [Metabacillus schmidteae]|uniref:FusB/FusC family EF-G-binding protein n=1 Tax=Metabacillus schmidteae TaxID=2730405 RepID=UPI002E2B1D4A|nr:FusB/FusC family EF-G-binding protein [Metabacillus schmidteae]